MTIFERFMEKSYKYDVAGHLFEVIMPEEYPAQDYLKPYQPFVCNGSEGKPLFSLRLVIVDDLKDTGSGRKINCLNDEPPYMWMFLPEGETDDSVRFNFAFSYSKAHPDCIVVPSEDFSSNIVYVPRAGAGNLLEFALSNAMMLIYTFRTTPYETLMVHASVISHAGGAYMFLGRSGTGKSTHSRLWLDNIGDTSLLNDDNPVIRIVDGEVYVFGTPWSGKTPCYKNEHLPLRAVVRLSQAPHNSISRLPMLQAYASLMPACSCMRWDRASTDALHKTVEKVIARIGGWHLECLPDADAAHVCHAAVTE